MMQMKLARKLRSDGRTSASLLMKSSDPPFVKTPVKCQGMLIFALSGNGFSLLTLLVLGLFIWLVGITTFLFISGL